MSACDRHNPSDVRRESLLALSRVFSALAAEQHDRAELITDPRLSTAVEGCSSVLFALGATLEAAAGGDARPLSDFAWAASEYLSGQTFAPNYTVSEPAPN